jgi:hypothetical protein
VGKAARRRRTGAPGGDKSRAEAALVRLSRASSPGDLTLAGAYALGYLGRADMQRDGGPGWLYDLDPVETLYFGAAWPEATMRFDSFPFSNACAAWLRTLRGTEHWAGIERFVRETIAVSDKHRLPVDGPELALLAAGRLERAGLDQDRLPDRILPGKLLHGPGLRCVTGPDLDMVLPDPAPGADTLIDRFWASVRTPERLPPDGTAADAMREGLNGIHRAGLRARGLPVLLLAALYASLVADGFGENTGIGDISGSAEQSQAWALGLASDSPLIPVTDLLLIGAKRDLSPDDILARLYSIPAFTGPVRRADRIWHSSPGTALMSIAFELGYREVQLRNATAVRADPTEAITDQVQRRRFEEQFGRPPEPGDPLFWEPDADGPVPLTTETAEEARARILREVGACDAWQHAHDRTGILPLLNGSFATSQDRDDWNAAIAEYTRTHPGTVIDHQAELAKIQHDFADNAVHLAADDPDYGTGLAARLDTITDRDIDIPVLAAYLNASRGHLLGQLRNDPEVTERACEHARAWTGAELTAQVRAAITTTDADVPAAVLLTIAAAVATQPTP